MKASLAFVACAAAVAFAGCASNTLPADVHYVSLAVGTRRPPVVLAPARAAGFARMANERATWAVNQLRASIASELAAGGRFRVASVGAGDARITIESLRHGLVEVSANQYAPTIAGSVSITRGTQSVGTRDFSGTGGDIRSLAEFEDPAIYEAALKGAMDKVALELATSL